MNQDDLIKYAKEAGCFIAPNDSNKTLYTFFIDELTKFAYLITAKQAKQETATINIYYMNDNHTFERLTLDVEESLLKIKVQWDKGYTYGMLCFGDNKPKGLDVVHAHGKAKWAEFEKEVREVYKSIGDTSPPNQDAEEIEKTMEAK